MALTIWGQGNALVILRGTSCMPRSLMGGWDAGRWGMQGKWRVQSTISTPHPPGNQYRYPAGEALGSRIVPTTQNVVPRAYTMCTVVSPASHLCLCLWWVACTQSYVYPGIYHRYVQDVILFSLCLPNRCNLPQKLWVMHQCTFHSYL